MNQLGTYFDPTGDIRKTRQRLSTVIPKQQGMEHRKRGNKVTDSLKGSGSGKEAYERRKARPVTIQTS